MQEVIRELQHKQDYYRGYRIYLFGVMSAFSGGPWAVHVRKPDGTLFDAIYGCNDSSDALDKAIHSIREG